jgi:hypothetical protein
MPTTPDTFSPSDNDIVRQLCDDLDLDPGVPADLKHAKAVLRNARKGNSRCQIAVEEALAAL